MTARDSLFISVFVAYVVIISIISISFNPFIHAHTIFIFLFFFSLLIGQAFSFLREFLPFTVIIYAYQMLRGYTDNIAGSVHIDNIIHLERVFFGFIPTIALQEIFYSPGNLHLFDFITFILWSSHFVIPFSFAFLLWQYKKLLYYEYILALLFLTFAGFVTYIVFPVAPPWLAGHLGHLSPVALIRHEYLSHFHYGNAIALFVTQVNPNLVAAMPSLHAAYPFLSLLFTVYYFRKYAPFIFVYCTALWISLVYGGDHYVVDILAGILYATISFYIIHMATQKGLIKKLLQN